jgi:hypothetical protein
MEVWKPVVGLEHSHEVSNFGNIRTIPREITRANRWGGVSRIRLRQRNVKLRHTHDGYLIGNLALDHAKTLTIKAHRVVAQAFLPNPGNLPEVNHIDGDKTNNSVENLEWCTSKQNRAHAVATGLHACGERSPLAKLKEVEVKEIRYLRKLGFSGVDVGRLYGISHKLVSLIHKRRKWKHVADY